MVRTRSSGILAISTTFNSAEAAIGIRFADFKSLNPGETISVEMVFFVIHSLLKHLPPSYECLVLNAQLCQSLAAGTEPSIPEELYKRCGLWIIPLKNGITWRLLVLESPTVCMPLVASNEKDYGFKDDVRAILVDPTGASWGTNHAKRIMALLLKSLGQISLPNGSTLGRVPRIDVKDFTQWLSIGLSPNGYGLAVDSALKIFGFISFIINTIRYSQGTTINPINTLLSGGIVSSGRTFTRKDIYEMIIEAEPTSRRRSLRKMFKRTLEKTLDRESMVNPVLFQDTYQNNQETVSSATDTQNLSDPDFQPSPSTSKLIKSNVSKEPSRKSLTTEITISVDPESPQIPNSKILSSERCHSKPGSAEMQISPQTICPSESCKSAQLLKTNTERQTASEPIDHAESGAHVLAIHSYAKPFLPTEPSTIEISTHSTVFACSNLGSNIAEESVINTESFITSVSMTPEPNDHSTSESADNAESSDETISAHSGPDSFTQIESINITESSHQTDLAKFGTNSYTQVEPVNNIESISIQPEDNSRRPSENVSLTESTQFDSLTHSDGQIPTTHESISHKEPVDEPQISTESTSDRKFSQSLISGQSDDDSYMPPESISDSESLDSTMSKGSDQQLNLLKESLSKEEINEQLTPGTSGNEMYTNSDSLPIKSTRSLRKRNAAIDTTQLGQESPKFAKTTPKVSNSRYNLRERPEEDDCGSEEPLSDEEHRIIYVLWENIYTKDSPDFSGKRTKNSWGFWFSCVYHDTLEKFFKPEYVSDITKIDYDTLTDGDYKYFYIDLIHESDLFLPGQTPSDMFRLGLPREKAKPSLILLTKDFYTPCSEAEEGKSRKNFKNQKSGFHSEKGVAWKGRSVKIIGDGIFPEKIHKLVVNASFYDCGYYDDLTALISQPKFKNITTKYFLSYIFVFKII